MFVCIYLLEILVNHSAPLPLDAHHIPLHQQGLVDRDCQLALWEYFSFFQYFCDLFTWRACRRKEDEPARIPNWTSNANIAWRTW